MCGNMGNTHGDGYYPESNHALANEGHHESEAGVCGIGPSRRVQPEAALQPIWDQPEDRLQVAGTIRERGHYWTCGAQPKANSIARANTGNG